MLSNRLFFILIISYLCRWFRESTVKKFIYDIFIFSLLNVDYLVSYFTNIRTRRMWTCILIFTKIFILSFNMWHISLSCRLMHSCFSSKRNWMRAIAFGHFVGPSVCISGTKKLTITSCYATCFSFDTSNAEDHILLYSTVMIRFFHQTY